MATEDQLARVLGPDWQRMNWVQLADRATGLEQAAAFTRKLARYMAEAGAETAGEALERLNGASALPRRFDSA